METKWYLSKKYSAILLGMLILIVIYFAFFNEHVFLDEDKPQTSPKLLYHIRNKRDSKRRSAKESSIRLLKDEMKLDKGTGCIIPKVDPFDKQMTRFDEIRPKVVCHGQNWVQCNFSKCMVRETILKKYKVTCEYRDLIYDTDRKSHFGKTMKLGGDETYVLQKSDHVSVSCAEKSNERSRAGQWSGLLIGYRTNVNVKPPRTDRVNTHNVLLFAFDSTSKNGFIRRMPRSYKVLQKELGAVILNGYNIVADATTGAIFPLLTGKNEFELPDIRQQFTSRGNDDLPWIFYTMKDDGYRTAYFEDMPWVGTFQMRHNGWFRQPTHHYSRSFFVQLSKLFYPKSSKYCIGDKPSYKLMMDLTTDFFKFKGKKFCFTFVADITHDDFNMIATADEDMANFLKQFKEDGRLNDTFLIVMGDHGPRYSKARKTYLGQLEERHPLMAIVLPEQLQKKRPDSLKALRSNVDVLTTPYDIHTTILDVVGMRNKRNKYKVPGTQIPRGLSLLYPVPKNRSCSEAGVEPHWCACLRRKAIPRSDPMFAKVATALVDHINFLIKDNRLSCMRRYLVSVDYVLRHLSLNSTLQKSSVTGEHYTVKMVIGPGSGTYEATGTYLKDKDKFEISTKDIQRTNAYGDEPSCIREQSPHLNMFCYCRGYYNRHDEKKEKSNYENKSIVALASKEVRIDSLNNNRRVDRLNSKKRRVDGLTRKKVRVDGLTRKKERINGLTRKKERAVRLTRKNERSNSRKNKKIRGLTNQKKGRVDSLTTKGMDRSKDKD